MSARRVRVLRGAAATSLALALCALVVCPAAAAVAGGTTSSVNQSAAVDPSPLAANGFESPSCLSPVLTAQLSQAERTNCAVSGVAIAPVPLSNYAIDVNIPSGLEASVGQDAFTVVQDLFVTPIWTAVVWLIHVVLIALEWCYSIDLLGPATLARASSALGGARRVFTDPWLGLALAVAAVGFAWQGLVRRRVLDTLGQAALLAVMVTAGLWIIADPVGTVGAVGNLADRAALATVAASATGDPSQPVATVDGAFGEVFDAATDGPWCYLEFGDVDWCRDPAALDPALRATATHVEEVLRAEASCGQSAVGLVHCAPGGSALQSQLSGAATALADATTNGALFLALPPDAVERVALSNQTVTPTLYGTLCGSNDPTQCTAATAPQAEFRTASGTWPRVGGLLLIVIGTIGMLLLLSFIALRLLGAALATLLYLMLAPLAVLAPALGESGRDAFRLWLTRLVGAVLSKLVYSVALGVVLLVVTLLTSLSELGWWTQWLLVSVFWWVAFEQRHRLLSLVLHERGEPARRAPFATRAWLAGRSVGAGAGALRASGRIVAGAGLGAAAGVKAWRELPQEGSAAPLRGRRGGGGFGGAAVSVRERSAEAVGNRERRAQARGELSAQVRRVRDVARTSAAGGRMAAGETGTRGAEIAALEARRARIATSLRSARERGETRRVLSLQARAQGVAAELASRRQDRGTAQGAGIIGGVRARVVRAGTAPLSAVRQGRATARLLDRAAQAPPGALMRGPANRAAPLAGLAGVSPAAYLRSAPGDQRLARLQIERELSRRRQLLRDRALSSRGTHRPPQPGGEGARERESRAGAPITPRARQFGSRER